MAHVEVVSPYGCSHGRFVHEINRLKTDGFHLSDDNQVCLCRLLQLSGQIEDGLLVSEGPYRRLHHV